MTRPEVPNQSELNELGQDPTNDLWLDALIARQGGKTDAEAEIEAQSLARALQAELDSWDGDSNFRALAASAITERKLDDILSELGRGRSEVRSRSWWALWSPAGGLALVAAIAWFMVGPLLTHTMETRPPEPPTWRGGQPYSIAVSNPKRTVTEITRELARMGIDHSLYQEGSSFIVDIDLPASPPRALVDLLNEFGIDNARGLVRIEVTLPQPSRQR